MSTYTLTIIAPAPNVLTVGETVNSLTISTGAPVISVNTKTGVVVLDPDDLDDTTTTNKFTTAAEISKLAGIETSADVTDEGNVIPAIDGATIPTATVAGTDKVLIQDVDDADNLKTVTAQDIANLSAGTTEFTGLTDTPSSYSGQADKVLNVNSGETAVEFKPVGDLPLARITGSTYSTVQHLQDIFHSTGWTSGGAIANDADGTITIAAGTGLIRATDDILGTIYYTDWSAESGANVALVDASINYVYVEYNSGSPQVIATTTKRTDENTNIFLGTVYRDNVTLHITTTRVPRVGDHALQMINRMKLLQPFAHESGAILSEVGTRNIAWTAGVFWEGLASFPTLLGDSSGAAPSNNSFEYFYYNGSSWITLDEVVDAVIFSGAGLDDATSGGSFNGSHSLSVNVIIDSTGGTDTFKWNYLGNDGVTVVETTGVAITGAAQSLIDGVEVTFAATTGHTVNDAWLIEAYLSKQIDNTQYNDIATGLATLSNNKYGVHWIYLDIHGHVSCLFGQGDYTLTEAQDAPVPATLPAEFEDHIRLIGKIIIKKSEATFTVIENNYMSPFVGSITASHDDLTDVVANEHIDHSTVSVNTASLSGLSGGGTIAANRSHILDVSNLTSETTLAISDTLVIDDGTATNKKITVSNSILMKREVYIDSELMIPAGINPAVLTQYNTTTNRIGYTVWDFDPSTAETVWFKYVLPTTWDGGQMKIEYYWKGVSSGNVVWRNKTVALADSDVIDSTLTTSTGVVDGVTGTGDIMITGTDSFSPASAGKKDILMVGIYRDAANASDTYGGDAGLFGVNIQYTESVMPVGI